MFLIDGHNLLGRTPGLSLSREEEGREEIVRALGARGGKGGRRTVVVFDGNRPGAAREERVGGLTVVYSPAGRSADDEILRRAGAADPRGVTVVTSDLGLAQRAKWAGCQVESCECYRKRLAPRRAPVPDKPEAAPGDVDEWLAAFASRKPPS